MHITELHFTVIFLNNLRHFRTLFFLFNTAHYVHMTNQKFQKIHKHQMMKIN